MLRTISLSLVPCGAGFCYHGGECVVDKKTGEAKCICPGNYTLPDCSGGSSTIVFDYESVSNLMS